VGQAEERRKIEEGALGEDGFGADLNALSDLRGVGELARQGQPSENARDTEQAALAHFGISQPHRRLASGWIEQHHENVPVDLIVALVVSLPVFRCEGNYEDYEADRKKRLGEEAEWPHRIKYKKLRA